VAEEKNKRRNKKKESKAAGMATETLTEKEEE